MNGLIKIRKVRRKNEFPRKVCVDCERNRFEDYFDGDSERCRECQGKINSQKKMHRITDRNMDTRMGVCSKCGPMDLTLEGFCAERARNNRRSYTPEQIRDKMYLDKFGITLEQYNEMREEQNYSCKICQRHESEFAVSMAVDHDHSCCSERKRSCGKCIRGLLCSNCNRGIGHLMEDIVIMERSIQYVKGEL